MAGKNRLPRTWHRRNDIGPKQHNFAERAVVLSMSWIVLSLASAVCLGVYDLFKKLAVKENAVPPVLLLSVSTAAILYLPLVVFSWTNQTAAGQAWHVQELTLIEHVQVLAKSLIVGASWCCAFFALKHLPISIAAPIRATSPLWTMLFAVGILAERPSPPQWSGVLVILVAFFYLSFIGREEGAGFRGNKWVWLMCLATGLGAASALYDKYLLQNLELPIVSLQAWFSIYLVPVMLPLAVYWYRHDRAAKPFEFRWSIPAIAITLLVTDLLYFRAVSHPEALISVVSPIRRTSVMIPFVFGIAWLGELNGRRKLLCIVLMLFGVVLIGLDR